MGYYTPDWLCERVLAEFDLTPETRVLDPACGSGSFLRAAVARLLDAHPDLSAEQVARQAVGIDIHPLSVQIAKTTLLLALGDKVRAAPQPVTLGVFLANTLRLPEGTVGLFGDRFTLTIDRQQYSLPTAVFADPGLFDVATAVADDLAESTLNGADEPRETFAAALKRQGHGGLSPELIEGFHNIYRGMKQAKRAGRDSIWKFILQNAYKPFFLREQFDLIVGNPPWLTYADVRSEDYQNELRALGDKYNLLSNRRANAPHLEIAAIFMAHAASYFLRDKGKIAFVLPRSFFSADHHDATRAGRTLGFRLTHVWDLDDVEPLFRVPACVLIGEKAHALRTYPKSGRPGYAVSGRLPDHNATWAEAAPGLTFSKATWYHGRLGSLSAFTRRRALTKPTAQAAPYKPLFKQGATLVPRNFYFVEPAGVPPPDFQNRVLTVQTAEEQRKLAKPPWKEHALDGRVHSDYLFRTALSKSMLPFALVAPDLVLLPIEIDGDTVRMLTHDAVKKRGDLDTARWFQQVEALWQKHRTAKSKKLSYLGRLDFQNGLSEQRLDLPYLVLYTAAAKDASAVVLHRTDLDLPFVVDHMAYWFGTEDEDEAYYLAAFLNSGYPNDLIKDFQSRGLFGPRHVHKKILEIPLPRFDRSDSVHVELAEHGRAAEAAAAAFTRHVDPAELVGVKLGSARLALRKHLSDRLNQIDRLVKRAVEGD